MLEIKNISIRSNTFSLDSISFSIQQATCLSLMGKSGSGKTTIMEAICGLRPISSGTVLLHSKEITHLPPAARNIAFVPQDNALFQHLTVKENITFGLQLKKLPPSEINHRANDLAANLNISHLLKRKPHTLSGGEAKRVALARSLAIKPALLCLDEPLIGLDKQTHEETLHLIKSTIRQEKTTTLHITHSHIDAEKLSDSITHMSEITQP